MDRDKHILTIDSKNRKIRLDGFELKRVTALELKATQSYYAELSLKMNVALFDRETNTDDSTSVKDIQWEALSVSPADNPEMEAFFGYSEWLQRLSKSCKSNEELRELTKAMASVVKRFSQGKVLFGGGYGSGDQE